MLRLQSGDDTALAELYALLANNVYALALHMLRNREDAEEVLQDTFIKLHQNAHHYKSNLGSVKAYAYTIARNEARMRLRKQQSRPHKADTYDVHDGSLSATTTDPDTHLSVQTALELLPTEEAQLLKASFFDGYSHAELSEQTGMPLGTLKSRIRRALLKLRDALVDA